MASDKIIIKGACEHNLKCIDVEIPRDRLVVITGISGSGKSTLAFDTIYAEGQRRYVESLSAYARQFLEQMEKPDVESIEGLSPAISIEQKTTSKNPRSTVGTVTEIYDYLRLLFARVGRPHCYNCGKAIASQTVSQMVDQIMALPAGTKFNLLSPMVRGRKGEYKKELQQLRKDGFVRVIVDGVQYELSEEIVLDKNKKHDIDIVVDRLIVKEGLEKRLADSLETALNHAEGVVKVAIVDGDTILFSEALACIGEHLSTCAWNVEYWSWQVAECYAVAGAQEAALDWLENATRRGFVHYPYLSRMGTFRSLHGNPRFQDLLGKVRTTWEEMQRLEL